jgi:bifunctional ADP-heptose synthase (sugar kinase/adenylyltransferase)
MTNILVIGDIIVDHYMWGSINRKSPEDSTIDVVDIEKESYRLGGAGNVAVNIKNEDPNLIVEVFSLFNVWAREALYLKKIEALGPYVSSDSNAIIKMRIIDQYDKQVVRLDKNREFFENDIINFNECLSDLNLSRYDYIVVSDYCKGIVNDNVIKLLENFNGTVFVDTKKKDLRIWNNIKNCIIKINEKEWNQSNQQSSHDVIITMSSRSAKVYFKELCFLTFGLKNVIPASNSIGAGDAFLSGLVVKYSKCKDICDSIKYANLVAGKSVTRPIGE